MDEHRVEISIQILVEHGRYAGSRIFRENSEVFTSKKRKTAEFLSDSLSFATEVTTRHFSLIKFREMNEFNTNFHRENFYVLPSFLVLFQSCVERTSGVELVVGALRIYESVQIEAHDSEIEF